MKRDVPCERPDGDCPEQAAGSSSDSLSTAFVQEAVNRFGLVGLTVAGCCLVSFLVGLFIHETSGAHDHATISMRRMTSATVGLLSLAMFAVSRTKVCPRLQLDMGLAYQVVGAVLISFSSYWGRDLDPKQIMQPMGWIMVWIVLFPLVVPARPLKNIVCSLVTASTAPVLWGISQAVNGLPFPDWHVSVGVFLPLYICVGLATMPAVVMYRLGKEVTAVQRELKALGSYQLVEQLGGGGMGEVWRAEHRMLARPAAVKLIKKEMLAQEGDTDPDNAIARFGREAQATAALTSPHTISLYDFGVTDEGTFYYVMELLAGIDLETLVERHGPVCPKRTVHLLVQACHSLAEAHAVGMIHRDVKPANMFLCKQGLEHDFVKLLDFGLVRQDRRQRSDADSLKLTGNDAIVGTPAFMAPEQVQGQEEIDSRADIYALGCVGYWLLTGRYVFEASSAMNMLIDHVKTEPEPASKRIGKPIPPELDQVLLDCLQKDRLLRPASAEDLAQRLLATDVGEWGQADARRWWREHMADADDVAVTVDPRATTTLEGVKIPVS